MSLVRAASIVLLPTLTLGAVVLSGSANSVRAAASARPTAPVAGVMINRTIDREGEDMPDLAFQGTFARTKFAIVVDNPQGGIIGVDRDASSIAQFLDDTGKSLVNENGPWGPFGFGERIVKGGTRVALELESQEAPAKDAKFVNAAGQIAVRIAHEKRTSTSQSGVFAKDAVFECGPYTLTVMNEGPSQWGEGHEIEFQTNDDLDSVIRYWIIDAEGNEVALEPMSTMTFGETSRITLVCESQQTAGRLSIEAWHDAKTKKVPFDVTAAVGLR